MSAVAPLAGAWVETSRPRPERGWSSRSPLSRGRGSKPRPRVADRRRERSPLSRGRGSKQDLVTAGALVEESPLSRGRGSKQGQAYVQQFNDMSPLSRGVSRNPLLLRLLRGHGGFQHRDAVFDIVGLALHVHEINLHRPLHVDHTTVVRPASETSDGDARPPTIERTEKRERNRAFWNCFIQEIQFDHPDQAPPTHRGDNWCRIKLFRPIRWLSAWLGR